MQTTSKKQLLWNERVKLGKLELQECAGKQQKEVIMDLKGGVGETGAAGMCRQPAKRKGEVGKTGAAGMCRQPAKSSYYGMRG